jgi:hypothetical protein
MEKTLQQFESNLFGAGDSVREFVFLKKYLFSI